MYAAVQVDSGWPLEWWQRQDVHRRIKRAFYSNCKAVPCAVCGKALPPEAATLEHIDPRSKGGSYDGFNLTITCKRCNAERGNGCFWEYRHGLRASVRRGDKKPPLILLACIEEADNAWQRSSRMTA